ncbi:hypothetical protein [Marinobacter changyiensis]|uniref:hypothetical protein n=1 Tax=Marinobacter changyiensis TaxID=2604091 RepID=UPI0012652248|nr:hypothetical protein [Marinobacter changyiensis]
MFLRKSGEKQDGQRRQRSGWSVLLSALVALLGIMAGGVASIFTDEIRRAFPFVHFGKWESFFSDTAYGPLVPEAMAFWVLAAVFFLLVFWRDAAASRRRARAQSDLLSATGKLQEQIDAYTDTLRTMPPQHFLSIYRETYKNCQKAAKLAQYAAQVSTDLEEIQHKLAEAIRTVLTGLVDLAFTWDSPVPEQLGKVTYRANIMLFRAFEDMDASEQEEVWARSRFFVDTNLVAAKASLDGVLDLANSIFTTTTESPKPLPDDSVQPLALPLTKLPRKEGKRVQNLPGAPSAFVTRRSEWILSPEAMVEKCELVPGLNNTDTLEEIKKYYLHDEKAQSIVSLPLLPQDGGEAVGVVNIYRNKNSILKDRKRSEEFDAVAFPFCTILIDLLAEYYTAPDLVGVEVKGTGANSKESVGFGSDC